MGTDIKEFNRKLIDEFRASRGQLSGPMAGRQIMLLTTRGHRTGRDRTVVIGYRPAGDKFVVIASASGAPADPAWYRNLQAHNHATAEVGDRKLHVARPHRRRRGAGAPRRPGRVPCDRAGEDLAQDPGRRPGAGQVDPFAGERPEHHMKKTRVEHPRVTCGTCRKFDGTAWCRHWNFHTTAESPPCRFYTKGKTLRRP
jgi:deazaflavin-dependent oxidoreductase (nitroreductase family)